MKKYLLNLTYFVVFVEKIVLKDLVNNVIDFNISIFNVFWKFTGNELSDSFNCSKLF